MSPISLRRLEVLRELGACLAASSTDAVAEDAFRLVIAGSGARAGAAFFGHGPPEPVAEHGLAGDERHQRRVRSVLATVSRRVVAARRRLRSVAPPPDGELGNDAGEFVATEIAAAGFGALLAMPIEQHRSVLGVLVLLFKDTETLDPECECFAEIAADFLAIAIERDRRIETEREHRDELEHSARMAALGLLTATVAHELRGPVGALVLQIEEQRRLVDQLALFAGSVDTAVGGVSAELAELTEDIGVAIARVRDTVEQLSTLSRRDSAPEPIELAQVARDSLVVARPHLERRGIVLSEELQPGCFTKGRRDNIGQVVLNLVLNAADACQEAQHPKIVVRTEDDGEQVILTVDDNGPGIAADAVKNIFRPFYTTKPRGQGTGLGLKICSDVVAEHGGHIEVTSGAEGGASFRVYLPKTADSSGVHPVAQKSDRPRLDLAQQRSVLVVDDDTVFARTVRRSLKPHEVRTAATASEAEIALLDPKYSPDLVLCDVFLPGANGDALHARILARRPEIAARFVFVTGGGLGKLEADYIRQSGCRTLFKPIDLRDLLESLEHESRDSVPNSLRTLSQSSQRPPARSSLPPTPRK